MAASVVGFETLSDEDDASDFGAEPSPAGAAHRTRSGSGGAGGGAHGRRRSSQKEIWGRRVSRIWHGGQCFGAEFVREGFTVGPVYRCRKLAGVPLNETWPLHVPLEEDERQDATMDEMFVEFFDAIDELSDNDELEGTSG